MKICTSGMSRPLVQEGSTDAISVLATIAGCIWQQLPPNFGSLCCKLSLSHGKIVQHMRELHCALPLQENEVGTKPSLLTHLLSHWTHVMLSLSRKGVIILKVQQAERGNME